MEQDKKAEEMGKNVSSENLLDPLMAEYKRICG
jgi:hypothetical protein